jgi:hypothetical protein
MDKGLILAMALVKGMILAMALDGTGQWADTSHGTRGYWTKG